MRKVRLFGYAVAAVVALASTGVWAEGDPAKGKKVFGKCKACHTVKEGKHRQGPSLFGVVGRKAGTVEGFKKYKDMKVAGETGLTWSEETLSAFLLRDGKKGPKEYIGSVIGKDKANIGTMKTFKGIKEQADIDNLIAFLKESTM